MRVEEAVRRSQTGYARRPMLVSPKGVLKWLVCHGPAFYSNPERAFIVWNSDMTRAIELHPSDVVYHALSRDDWEPWERWDRDAQYVIVFYTRPPSPRRPGASWDDFSY